MWLGRRSGDLVEVAHSSCKRLPRSRHEPAQPPMWPSLFYNIIDQASVRMESELYGYWSWVRLILRLSERTEEKSRVMHHQDSSDLSPNHRQDVARSCWASRKRQGMGGKTDFCFYLIKLHDPKGIIRNTFARKFKEKISSEICTMSRPFLLFSAKNALIIKICN